MSRRQTAGTVVESYTLANFELPSDFQMPTAQEIEQDLALGNAGWTSLLRSSESLPKQPTHWFGRFFASPLPKALVLFAAVALVAALCGEVATAIDSSHRTRPSPANARTAQVTSPHFIWTARGPIRFDELLVEAFPPTPSKEVKKFVLREHFLAAKPGQDGRVQQAGGSK